MTETTPHLHFYNDSLKFTTEETPFGTVRSYSPEGKALITSATLDQCVAATLFYLDGLENGWDSLACSSYDGEVGGKL